MAEFFQGSFPYPNAVAKNLFVCDDKSGKHILIVVKGDKKVDLKESRQKNNTRRLSFASEEELHNILRLKAGAVTPLGILNDKDKIVKVYFDKKFFELNQNIIGVHPNENTSTVFLKTIDLVDILKEHRNFVEIVEL